jgi:hypothetical protein
MPILGWFLVCFAVVLGLLAAGWKIRWAWKAVLAGVSVGLGGVALCTLGFQDYGWTLFVVLPIALGFLTSALVLEVKRSADMRCLAAALGLVFGFVAVGLVLFGLEGLVCLAMAAPLVFPLALLGAWAGLKDYDRRRVPAAPTVSMLALLLPFSLGLGLDRTLAPLPALHAVRTAVAVDAPPERVWRHVLSFPQLAPPRDLLFRAGIAYPIRAEISGRGAGAVRRCIFSTGAFVEPIVAWDEPRLLRFTVRESPPALIELSPYSIHPPHVATCLRSREGQFLLTRLPGNRTLLAGTTWYQDALQPAAYWRWWSDPILHRIHRRVLDEIKLRAEADRG